MSKKGFFTRRDNSGDVIGIRVGRIIATAIVAVIAIILLFSCISTVPTGYTGILTTFGRVEDRTMSAGVHLIAPWQKIVKMDNRTQKSESKLQAFSADIQQVDIQLSVNYCINQETAQTLYKTVGINYFENVLYPRILENTKAVFANYTAEELVANRQKLSGEIQERLAVDADKYGITIISLSVEDVDFTDAFTNAVEAKQVAAQNKLTAETEQAQKTMEQKAAAERAVIQAEADADVAKIAAEGEAEALKIKAEAEAEANKKVSNSLTNLLIKKIYLDSWDGKLPSYYMGSGDANILFDIPLEADPNDGVNFGSFVE